jgi:mono/diheme cytochrome c family protein
MWGTAVAPNLAALTRRASAATFERALRHGIAHDGRAVYSMPAYNFVRLRDADVADIYAYLRTVPVVDVPLPRAGLPWPIRWEIARGRDAAIPAFLGKVPPLARTNDPDSAIVRGEYIAMTTCIECHGFSLRADSPFGGETAPDLAIVSGYPFEAFERLMRTGKPIGGRELRMMSGVARGRFAHFTDQEVHDLYAFLRDMGARAMKSKTD